MKVRTLHILAAAAIAAAAACGGEKSSSGSAGENAQAAPESQTHEAAAMAEEAAAPVAEEAEPMVIPVEAVTEAEEEIIGDAVRGKRVFVKCFACHGIDEGQNKIGPSLYGVVGASAGHVEGFAYSAAIADSGLVWTPAVLSAYLENPAKYLPGNKMLFPGLASAQDRADVIAYLEANGAQ